jgi:hypothetical protein
LVYLKKPKFYKEKDPYQVYLRITVDGAPVEYLLKGHGSLPGGIIGTGRQPGQSKMLNPSIPFCPCFCEVHEAGEN